MYGLVASVFAGGRDARLLVAVGDVASCDMPPLGGLPAPVNLLPLRGELILTVLLIWDVVGEMKLSVVQTSSSFERRMARKV